jgi:hypothetical protein
MRALPAHALKAFASQTAVAGRRLGAQDRLRAQGAGRRAAEPQARQGRCRAQGAARRAPASRRGSQQAPKPSEVCRAGRGKGARGMPTNASGDNDGVEVG